MLDIKQGKSGFKVSLLDNKFVVKSTSGKESSIKLLRDALKQISFEDKFQNINVAKIFDLKYCGEFGQDASFLMDYLGEDLGFSNHIDLNYLEKELKQNLLFRCESANFGLNNILSQEVERIKSFVREIHGQEESEKIKLKDYLCNKDSYLHGSCHGDFGLRNMYFNKQCIYISDFTHSFIDSPLLDVVMLKISGQDVMNEEKKKMVDSIYNSYKKDYGQQMIAILKVKTLAWDYRC